MRLALLLVLLGAAPGAAERIVFLGDSITDGHTAPLLVRQALGPNAPLCINAGVAGDTAAGMRARLERDVLPRRPTLVALSVGINDVLRNVSAPDYEKDVRAISERLRREGIPLLILTPTILGPKHADAEKRLVDYMAALKRLASERSYAVAEVYASMYDGRAAGLELLEPDQVHLTFEGYRVMVRAILDGLGRKDAAVPKEAALEPMPGLLPEWKVRALPDGEWKPLSLPQAGKAAHWWMDQERRRGFAVELGAKRVEAVATLESKEARDVFLNTGAELASVTLNGTRIWKSEGWTGWHAGKERLAARLVAGTNTLEIEAGGAFFLSVTDDNSW
jgi:lysophospholipase L1-like esterase